MVLLSVALPAPPALASFMRPASVEIIALPPAALHSPRDGRVNGNGFTAQVSGYRFGDQFGAGSDARRAAPGQVLFVFGVTSSSNSVTACLVVDGHAEVLAGEAGYSPVAPTYYLASVPGKATDVALELSENGFAQEFSFTKGHREGLQPSVLYESATGWELTERLTGLASLSVRDPGGVQGTSQQPLLVSAALTYFVPGTNAVPSGPSKAWLVVNGSTIAYFASSGPGVPGFSYTRPMTGRDLTLTLPGSTAMTAKTASGQAGSLFNGTYYWQVPASMTLATLKMSLPPVAPSGPGSSAAPGVFRATVSADPLQVDFSGPDQPLTTLGANAAPPPTGTLTPTSTGQRDDVAFGGTSKNGTAPVPWWLLVPVVLVVVAAGFLMRWRGLLPAWAAGGRRTGNDPRPRLGTTDAPEPTLSVSPSGGAVPGAPLPLPEGAVLQMVGQVRLVRLPEPAEASTEVPGLPSLAVRHSPGPVAAAAPPSWSGFGAAAAPAPSSVTPSRVLVSVPAGPPQLPEGAKELQVLGQPRLVAEPGGALELGASELELLARLALEPGRTFSSEELRSDIGTAKDTDWAPTTLWTRASALRRAIGAEHVPSSSKAGGYRLVGIGTDVARFEAAIARSKADPDGAPAHLAGALSLVRGAPFAGVPAGGFGWALDSGGVATRVANEVHEAAVKLARLAVGAGDAAIAAWAVAQGRLVSRDDELLDELELDAAAVSPDHSALARTWASTKRRYRTARKKVPGQLVAHYRELREKGPPGS
jgi:hypothetical protein